MKNLKLILTEEQAIEIQEKLNNLLQLVVEIECWQKGDTDEGDLEYCMNKIMKYTWTEIQQFIEQLGMEVEDV